MWVLVALILLYLWYNSKQHEPQATPGAGEVTGGNSSVEIGTNLSSRIDKTTNSFVRSFTPSLDNSAILGRFYKGSTLSPQDTGAPSSPLPRIPATGFHPRVNYRTKNEYPNPMPTPEGGYCPGSATAPSAMGAMPGGMRVTSMAGSTKSAPVHHAPLPSPARVIRRAPVSTARRANLPAPKRTGVAWGA